MDRTARSWSRAIVVGAFVISAAGTGSSAELPRRRPLSSDAIRSEKRTDSFGYPLATADKVEMLKLLQSGDFASLDRVLGQYERDAESDVHREDWVGAAIDAFDVADPTLLPRLDQWVEKMPKSAVARLARAAYWDAVAWQARGSKYARETASAQMDAMRDYSSRELADVLKALELDPRFTEGYRFLINIYNSTGRKADCRRAFEEGAKVQPTSFRLRAAYMNSLLPRWGGSYAAMDALAADSEHLAAANPRLRVLRGYIPWDRGGVLPEDKRQEREKAFREALSFGPHWFFYESLAYELSMSHRDEEALEAYSNADALVPQNAEILRGVAMMLLRTKQVDRARAALAAADAFDLAGFEKDKRAKLQADLLVSSGYKALQDGDSATALAALKEAQKKYPPNAPNHYWQGRAYLKDGDFERALAEFETAVQSDPRDIESYKNIDFLLARQGKWDAIIGRWNEYLRLEPRSGEGYLERGGAYLHKGDHESAIADANRACQFGNQKGCEVARTFGPASR